MRQHQESPLRPSHQPNGQVLAAEGSGNVEPPDLPDGLFANDEASKGIILNDDEENEPASCKPAGDEDCQEPRALREMEEHKMKILVAIDTTAGCIFKHIVVKKGCPRGQILCRQAR